MNSEFVHLHVHTQYSLLDGTCKIQPLIKKTKELGMDAIAITDHGVMYGVIDFYKAAKKEGIKPIIGCETYVASRSLYDKEPKFDSSSHHLVLLCKNMKGYMNLVKLVSIASVEGFYYKPRIDLEILKEYSEGLIGLSACLGGQIPKVVRYNYDEAKEIAQKYAEIFGEGNFYLELQDHGIPEQKTVNNLLFKMSRETGIPLVATNDIHFIEKKDSAAHDVLLCIQTGKKLDDEDRMDFGTEEFYVKSPDEMKDLFKYAPEAISNTVKIASMCNVEFEFGKTHLPKYFTDESQDSEKFLYDLCISGIKKKYAKEAESDKVIEKLNYEFKVIKQMGYVNYFLIVWDFIKFAKDNNIMVGPGRGSAAGSIVAYALDITDIDPIKYDLIFERFLNPERITMPDIDCDFCYERRQEVIDYVVRKYGRDHVANIITFGTMAARGVIRDVGRAMNLPYSKTDHIAKLIPMEPGMTLTKALEINPDLQAMYYNEEEVKYLIDIAKSLEGVNRHSSTHAAGVVISAMPLDELVPVQRNEDNVVTQFTMTTLEELGLLKMDFLGLRTLTVIRDCLELIKESTGKDLKLENVDDSDEYVYKKVLWEGKTEGVFQLESAGMKQFMKDLKPSSLEDIIAGISLYRPGPMDQIPLYIHNKNNPGDIQYDHPLLEKILSVTYGCMVYQEQVMAIVRELAGYSMGRADLVRRAMSKKKVNVMTEERKNFLYGIVKEDGEIEVPGCIRNGVSEEVGNKLFDQMMDFASYAFNKSHAAAYAVVAYRTAYLKAYYPVQFMAALMSSIMGNAGKISKYIQECKSLGIKVLPPDINYSNSGFSVNDNAIRFGLAAVKNIGEGPIQAIVEGRKDSLYQSFGDFLRKVDLNRINKKSVESLIKTGAFDSLGHKRSSLMEIYEKMMDAEHEKNKSNIAGQVSLFDISQGNNFSAEQDYYPDVKEFDKKEMLNMEKEMMGIYVSGHPLDEFKDQIESKSTFNTSMFKKSEEDLEDSEISSGNENRNKFVLKDRQSVAIAGIIQKISIKYTKSNNAMAFLNIEDLYGTIEIIVFPNTYSNCKKILAENEVVLIKGNLSVSEDEDPKIICESIEKLFNCLYLRMDIKKQKDSILKPLLSKYKGNVPISVYDVVSKKYYNILGENGINISDELIDELNQALGSKNVKLM